MWASFAGLIEVPGKRSGVQQQAGNLRLRSRQKFSPFTKNEVVRRDCAAEKFERIEPLAGVVCHNGLPKSAVQNAKLSPRISCAVPPHRDREKERGYNQAELLSKPLAKLLRLPHQGVLLVRKRRGPQSSC